MEIGAVLRHDGTCLFRVWAPLRKTVALRLLSPSVRTLEMKLDSQGYWEVLAEGVAPGMHYQYELDSGLLRPDPSSRYQPGGVHGPSAIVDHAAFSWQDKGWKGLAPAEMIMYELHIGTFTPEGTFEAAVCRLEDLRDLGVNAIEIMPIAQFPGERNWGYDGAYPFAVQNSYGGPAGLKQFVDACHRSGIAVILDVVYNHLGPEGNYLNDFGPYFTDKYRTPWGQAINFDDEYSDEVRNYFIENALQWFGDYHIDALRLDAIHGITDMSAMPFLRELANAVHTFSTDSGRTCYLVAESDLNDPKVVRPDALGGIGHDAQWNDDFHHALHTVLTGEREGYYADFGQLDQLGTAYREGFIYSGQYSTYRKRRHGEPSRDIPPEKFVVFSQNHDQVGNRMLGERLPTQVSFETLKLAAGLVLLSPNIPLLFMGEEYGEEAPFLDFVDHGDQGLIEAVRVGRKREFSSFSWKGAPPDPASLETYLRSKLRWESRIEGHHARLLAYYRALTGLRRSLSPFSADADRQVGVRHLLSAEVIALLIGKGDAQVAWLAHFGKEDARISRPFPEGAWQRLIDSGDSVWGGPGSLLPEHLEADADIVLRPKSFSVFVKEERT